MCSSDLGSAPAAVTAAARLVPPSSSNSPTSGYELSFHSDPYLLDGRYSNNAWLQELARPVTRLTWDNAVVMSPKLPGLYRLMFPGPGA